MTIKTIFFKYFKYFLIKRIFYNVIEKYKCAKYIYIMILVYY